MNQNYLPEIAAVIAEIGCFETALPSAGITATATEYVIAQIGPGPSPVALDSVRITPSATFAASDAAYWFVQIWKRTAGGSAVLLASGSSAATLNNPVVFTAWTPVALTKVAGAFLTPGDVITAAFTKVGAPAAMQGALVGCMGLS